MIPKVIHQIWIGPNPEPIIWTNTFKIDYIKNNPTYEYKLWDNEKVSELINKYPTLKIVYDLEPTWNGKSDILRYVILKEYGGIYIDADSVWVNNKSFDDLINCEEDIFAAKEPTTSHITGGVIGSVKDHPVFTDLINYIESYIKDGKKQFIKIRNFKGPSKLLGPILFDKFVKNYSVKLYPSNYFYPISWHGITDAEIHKKMEIPKDSYMFQYGYSTNNFGEKIK